jgi:hypothetical protein
VPEIVEQLDVEAERLFVSWDAAHRVAIKGLADERRAVYAELRALAGEPVRADIQRPTLRIEATADVAGAKLATSRRHLLVDEAGEYPTGGLLSWEQAVLASELDRCVAWYRNPSRASADALAIAYQDEVGVWRRLCPDFVFFSAVQGEVRASIVDPHGLYLSDALRKLRGIAAYAQEYGDELHRIESVARVDGVMRVLDFQRPEVRELVERVIDAEEAFRSPLAAAYVVS